MHDRAARVFKPRLSIPHPLSLYRDSENRLCFCKANPKLKKGNPGGRILPASHWPKFEFNLGLEGENRARRLPTFMSETS